MPWDGTELWVGEFDPDGHLTNLVHVAGGKHESIFQPQWSPDGTLYFVSDRSGWWNIYRWRGKRLEAICPLDAEFGLPQWIFNMSTYAIVSSNLILCAYTQKEGWDLAFLDTRTGRLTSLGLPYTYYSQVRAAENYAVFIAGSPTIPLSVVHYDFDTKQIKVLRSSSDIDISPHLISIPQAITYPTEHNQTAHAFFYPPKNDDFHGPDGEKPPLRVISHGGPTGATDSTFSLGIQYWTSRGIAVLDVNYGGSVGYGRAYRERLNGQWGVMDVDDCINGVRYLVERGLVDKDRLAISGGSAGGYTTLCALAFRKFFQVGASFYGVSDLKALAKDTHKFESRYMDRLVAPYAENPGLYYERSPIHHTENLSCPVILLQGLEDKVVPPAQAELIFEALRSKGIPVAYLAFEGEQHGFRRAETIKRALEATLYFYGKILGFEPADTMKPVKIENWR
jgi:dipeptidyl aminopeptidase/acylaminoacyl peptidase